MRQPTECTIIDISYKHMAMCGDRRDVDFHRYNPMPVRGLGECIHDIEATYEVERRQCIKVGSNEYIIWSPEFERYVGKGLAHINQLEHECQSLRHTIDVNKADIHDKAESLSYWKLKFVNQQGKLEDERKDKDEMFKSGLFAGIVAGISIIGNMYLWSTYVS